MDLTTVADDEAVVHDGTEVRRYDGLAPDSDHEIDGFTFRTLPRPPGELLARFTTVNDVHFGETECGIIEGLELGPTFSVGEGEDPYPQTMNQGAIAEMAAIDPDAVIVKGDLTAWGTVEEYDEFLAAYAVFGERLHHVRGNHDAYFGATFAADAPLAVDLPGVRLAVLDTTIPGETNGTVTQATLEWLADSAAESDRPVLVFGHHHVWSPESRTRTDDYFGIRPDPSERLIDLVATQPHIRGYFAGHTHRNRVRRFAVTGDRPWVEVACVKDFPGSWAEYRVHEGGILQIHRRISTPAALAWSEQTRQMFAGQYFDYAFGALADRCFAISTS
jgi:3',5'-cyclic-AMP phosphodiesterase